MKKYIAYCVIAGTLFFSSAAHAMNNQFSADKRNLELHTTKNHIIRAAAQKYNRNQPIIAISNDQLVDIIVKPKESLEENIKRLLAWSIMCTNFNSRLEDFGTMLKPYDNNAKGVLLPKLLRYYGCRSNRTRRALLLLVYAGAEHNHRGRLLQKAVEKDDIDMVSILFKHGANANLRRFLIGDPIFFAATNTKMIQLFLDNGADINEPGRSLPNVLWNSTYNPELMEFYINKGADPRTLDEKQRSILYYISFHRVCTPRTLKAIELLLNSIGDMINMTDRKGKTALDYLITKKRHREQDMINLFKKYGAKTSQELKHVKKAF